MNDGTATSYSNRQEIICNYFSTTLLIQYSLEVFIYYNHTTWRLINLQKIRYQIPHGLNLMDLKYQNDILDTWNDLQYLQLISTQFPTY